MVIHRRGGREPGGKAVVVSLVERDGNGLIVVDTMCTSDGQVALRTAGCCLLPSWVYELDHVSRPVRPCRYCLDTVGSFSKDAIYE